MALEVWIIPPLMVILGCPTAAVVQVDQSKNVAPVLLSEQIQRVTLFLNFVFFQLKQIF